MSVCSDDLYMEMNGCNSSGVVDDLFLGIEADFIGQSDLSDFFENDYFSELDDTRSLFQQFPNPSSLLPAPQRSAPSSPKTPPQGAWPGFYSRLRLGGAGAACRRRCWG